MRLLSAATPAEDPTELPTYPRWKLWGAAAIIALTVKDWLEMCTRGATELGYESGYRNGLRDLRFLEGRDERESPTLFAGRNVPETATELVQGIQGPAYCVRTGDSTCWRAEAGPPGAPLDGCHAVCTFLPPADA